MLMELLDKNVYIVGEFKYIMKIFTDLNEEAVSYTVIVEDINIPLSPVDRSSRPPQR